MKTFESIDSLSARSIQSIQDELLLAAVNHASDNSPFYRKRFRELGIRPGHIRGVADLERLPLTEREDLQQDNWAFLAAPREEVAELVSTTGTTGEPAFIALTGADLERLGRNEERSFGYAGAVPGDSFHLAVTCDNLFIAGIAYYRGIIQRGASVTRIGPQNIIRHLDLIQKLKPTGIVAVPSFMVHLARRVREQGLDPAALGLRKIVLIGDSIRDADFNSNALGALIESAFGAVCYSTYGITEAQLSFCECGMRRGLHSHPEFVLAEIVDDSGRPLPDGMIGELVLTPLQIEGMPLLRYRTGDVTFKRSEPCACGRNSVRIGPILGRKHHKLKVKGVTLFPKNIENALLCLKEVVNYQIEASTGDDRTDAILLRVGSRSTGDEFLTLLHDMLRAKARVTPQVVIETPEEIEKRLYAGGLRKAATFIDRRSVSPEERLP